jgi:hypothetical protein
VSRVAARRRGLGHLALAIVGPALALAVGGCSAGPHVAPGEASPPSATAPPSEPASPAPTRPPEDLWVRGLLVVGDDAVVPGALGSWVLDGAGSDSPWLPWKALDAIAIPPGVAVSIGLADRSSIGSWFADLADAVDVTGVAVVRLGGREADAPPLGSVQLMPMPTGRWVLAARLFRADGRGDGVTYWSVLVGP